MFRLILLTLLGNSLAKPYQQAETNFCTDKQPGLFSQGCSSNVTICNRYGKEMWLLCPFDLIFDGSIEECKDQKSVAECGSMSPERNSHVQDTKGLPNSLCEGSDDGYHSATECSNSVVQCVGGVSRLLECSMGQVFDNTQQSCVSPDDVPACRAADEASSTTTSSPSARIDCEGMTDGFFEKEPCSSFFLTCSGGISRILTCPANLVFDQKLTICEYPDNVEGCRAADGPSSQPSESSSASPSVCAEDGYFSYGNCSDTFYACTYGRQITMHCPAKLAFDESRQLCDYPFAVAICVEQESGENSGESSGEPSGDGSGESSGEASGWDYVETSGESSEASGEGSGDNYEASGEASGENYEASGEASGENFEASGESSGEGYEASGESSGESYEASGQSSGESYEASGEASGDSYEASGEASGDSHEASGEASGNSYEPSTTNKYQRTYYGRPAPSNESDEGSAEASGESSGAHEGYSSYGDEAPGGLSHKASASYEASGESSGNDAQGAAANSAYQAPEGEAQNQQSESTTAVPETVRAFCEGKKDGFYANGCSSEVIACRGGEASSMLCPSHMLYDEQKRVCEYPQNVPCYTAAKDQGAHETCSTEGPSANGRCSRIFTNCVEGKAYQLACDEGYVFSEEHRSCAESSKVKECSTAQSEPSTETNEQPEGGYSAPQGEESTPLPRQPFADAGYSAPHGEDSTPLPQQPSADAGYSAPHGEESTPLPQQPSADAGYSAPQDEQSTPMPQQPSADAGYSASQDEQSTPMPQQPSADAGYSAPQDEQSTQMPQQPSADAGYSAPQDEQSTQMPQQPSADAGYSAPHVEESTPMPQQPSADAGYSAPHVEESTPMSQQPSADAGYSAPHVEESTSMPQQPSADAGYSAPHAEESTPMPQQPSADAGYSAPHVEESTPMPQQPSADAGYSAPQDQQSTPIPQQPSADAGYSAPQSEETTPLPQQPGGDVSYSAPEMKVPAPRPQQTTADARRPAQFAERAPPPRQPDSDGRYSAPEMKASAPRQQRPVDSAATASVARKPTPQIQQQAAEMNRQSPKSPKPTPQVRPAASGSRPAPGSQRSAADTGRQAPMSQKPISQAPRPATGAGHTAPITRGSGMRSEQPARSNVETKPQQY